MNKSTSFLGRFSPRSREYKSNIQLLDDHETVTAHYKRSDNGVVLLDFVCNHLNLLDKDFFGLRYQDKDRHRYWIDNAKPILKQVAGVDGAGLRFRVRYYPLDPSKLDEVARYQLFVQVQRDLLHGRLYCPPSDAPLLGALIVQSELGDYDPVTHSDGYISEYKLFLKQTSKLESKIAEEHGKLTGLTPADAETRFLQIVSDKLETYGYDPYAVKDSNGTVYIGSTPHAVLIYRGPQKMHHIRWNELYRVDYSGKELRIYPNDRYFLSMTGDASSFHNNVGVNGSAMPTKMTNGSSSATSPSATGSKEKKVIKLICPSVTFAKHLWRHLLSQQAFYNEISASSVRPKFSKPRIPILSRGSTFRYSSIRVLNELEKMEANRPVDLNRSFTRYGLPRQESRHSSQPWSQNKFNTIPSMHPVSQRPKEIVENKTQNNEDTHNLSGSLNGSSFGGGDSSVEKEKVTTFTIHLSRTEPSSSTDDTTLDTTPIIEQLHGANGDLKQSPPSKNPPINRPIAERSSKNTSINHSIAEGSSSGPVRHSSQSSSSGIVGMMANALFTALLLLMLIVAVVVCIFEMGNPRWMDTYWPIAYARHELYEPARRQLMTRLG